MGYNHLSLIDVLGKKKKYAFFNTNRGILGLGKILRQESNWLLIIDEQRENIKELWINLENILKIREVLTKGKINVSLNDQEIESWLDLYISNGTKSKTIEKYKNQALQMLYYFYEHLKI